MISEQKFTSVLMGTYGFTSEQVNELKDYVRVRVYDGENYPSLLLLALSELAILDSGDVDWLARFYFEVDELQVFDGMVSKVPDDIKDLFAGTGYLPLRYNHNIRVVYLGRCLENLPKFELPKSVTLAYEFIDMFPHDYIRNHILLFGQPAYIRTVPAATVLQTIYREAIRLDAADTTISASKGVISVYYNVRKRKVRSNVPTDGVAMRDLVTTITINNAFIESSKLPHYLSIDIGSTHRGRVTVNTTVKGHVITLRIFSNDSFSKTLEDLNLRVDVVDFLRSEVRTRVPGIRIIAGETMSGKNTTTLAVLRELVEEDMHKIVEIGRPVEMYLEGVEQIDTQDTLEYQANIESTIRQNPDFVYITEMSDDSATHVIRISNTAKAVFSTIHANKVSGVIPRLMDMTGYGIDAIVNSIHSVLTQELVRDDASDTLMPVNTYLRFTDELKEELFGKSLGECISIIDGRVASYVK